MKFIGFAVGCALLFAGSAYAAGVNAPPTVPLVGANCTNSPCTGGVANDSTHWFYGFDPTTNASVQSLLTALQAPLTFNLPTGAATSALQTTANGYLLTLSTFTTSAATSAKQDTGNTSAATTATNTTAISSATGTTSDAAYGGSGNSSIIAALKGIYAALKGTLFIVPAQTTPAAPDISSVTTGGTAVNAFSAGHCAKGCIIRNPTNATQNLCGNGVTTASGTTDNAATLCAGAGQQITFTPRSTAISVVSSDSAHTFAGEGYQ